MLATRGNSNLANMGRRSFLWLLTATIAYFTECPSLATVSHSDDPTRPDDNSKLTPSVAFGPSRHSCGRAECPVSTDAEGNTWCWCRTADIRDICD